MPRSMTGYGAGRSAGPRLTVEVEVRSVNARSLKTSLRSPSLLSAHETDLESMIRSHVRRGTVNMNVRVELLRAEDAIRIRPSVIEGLALSLDPLRRSGLIEGKLTPDALAAIPGALETGLRKDLRPADWRVAKEAATQALTALNAMREREAKHLVKDLKGILTRMRKTLLVIRKRAPQVIKEHHAKLRERLAALLDDRDGIDEALLAREVAVLADRSDITEEITRLAAHLDEFSDYLAQGGEIGRTLEFLCQEILREVNTTGSKSGDVALTRAVIALKSDVDRLKEQVANLE